MSGGLSDGLAALAEEVKMVDMNERVLRGSRRIMMRNRVIAGVAAVAALSGGAVAVAAVRPTPNPIPIPPASESPVPSESPSPSPSVSVSVALPNVDIRNATFQVPAFPDDNKCPAATRAFKDGKVFVGGRDDEQTNLVMVDQPVRGDVDGEPGEEILTRLVCKGYESSGQVLAVKVAPDGQLTSLGFVLMSPDHRGFELIRGSLRVKDGTVLVDVASPDRLDGPMAVLDLQTRGYAYRNGKFAQVSGPTKFAVPPRDYRLVDFRNVTAVIHMPGNPPEEAFGIVKLNDGVGTLTLNNVHYEVTVVSSAFFTTRPAGVVLYRLKSERGQTTMSVHVYQFPIAVPGDLLGVVKDTASLAGASKVEASGDGVKVTINGRVFTYVESSDGSWVRSA